MSNTEGVNPKQAYGDKKVPVHLVPAALAVAASKGLGEGAVKYGAFNWRKNRVKTMTYVGAMLRHLYAWVDGEEIDPESLTGKHHLDGLAASLAILLDARAMGFVDDDRPPAGPGPKLVLTPKTQEEQLAEKRVAAGEFDVVEAWPSKAEFMNQQQATQHGWDLMAGPFDNIPKVIVK